jgi:hypothetical protein
MLVYNFGAFHNDMDVALVSAMAWVDAIEIAFKYSCEG